MVKYTCATWLPFSCKSIHGGISECCWLLASIDIRGSWCMFLAGTGLCSWVIWYWDYQECGTLLVEGGGGSFDWGWVGVGMVVIDLYHVSFGFELVPSWWFCMGQTVVVDVRSNGQFLPVTLTTSFLWLSPVFILTSWFNECATVVFCCNCMVHGGCQQGVIQWLYVDLSTSSGVVNSNSFGLEFLHGIAV